MGVECEVFACVSHSPPTIQAPTRKSVLCSLFSHANKISSTSTDKTAENQITTKHLQENGYPTAFIKRNSLDLQMSFPLNFLGCIGPDLSRPTHNTVTMYAHLAMSFFALSNALILRSYVLSWRNCIMRFNMVHELCCCIEVKLSIPLEAHHNAKPSETFLSFQAKKLTEL